MKLTRRQLRRLINESIDSSTESEKPAIVRLIRTGEPANINQAVELASMLGIDIAAEMYALDNKFIEDIIRDPASSQELLKAIAGKPSGRFDPPFADLIALRMLMEETMTAEEAVKPFQGDLRGSIWPILDVDNISSKVLLHLTKWHWPEFLRKISNHPNATPEVLSAVIDSHIDNYVFDRKTFRRLTTQPPGKSRHHIPRPTLQRDHNWTLTNIERIIINNPDVPADAIQRLRQAYVNTGSKYSVKRVDKVMEIMMKKRNNSEF